jgi:HEAT repeat protein
VRGTRKWVGRVGLALVLAVAGAAGWAVLNAPILKARYAARQLRTATTDDERARAADTLAGLGDPGLARLVEFVRAGDDPCRAAAAGAIDRLLAAMPDGEQRAVTVAGRLLDAFPACDDAGCRAVLEVLPTVLKRTGNAHAARCREAVAVGLKMPDPAARVLAVRLALHPDVGMRAELLPLLGAPEPEVRRAALVAIASADGEPAVGDEELFRWLHDPDEGVRTVCHDVLVGRDRSEAEIALGRRLAHPDPGERLKLLLDLRHDDDVADPEPWLERLSRDAEPAVRAGAARVATEVTAARRQTCPGWVARVADADPDATVRRVAAYFRRPPTVGRGEVRPLGVP